MESYELDALDMAGIYTRAVTMPDNTRKWAVYINGVSRGHFDDRYDAETYAIDCAYDILSETCVL